MKISKLSTRVATIWIEDDGIARLCFLPNAVIELNNAEEIIAAYLEIVKKSNKTHLPLLSDGRGLKSISHEARNRFSSENAAKYILANAILVNSLPTRLIANFFIKFHKPTFPVKIFSSEKDAIKWLKSFLKQQSPLIRQMTIKNNK